MTPADCFSQLWKQVHEDLKKSTKSTLKLPKIPDPEPLRYVALNDHNPAKYEPGPQRPCRWGPTIVLIRPPGLTLPVPPDEPETGERSAEDACWLAHEYGHFLSDKNGQRTTKYERALFFYNRGDLTEVCWCQMVAICGEEIRAWEYANAVLTKLGVTDWEKFNELRATGMTSYLSDLDKVNPLCAH